jgi:UDP-glucose 4-epimerase
MREYKTKNEPIPLTDPAMTRFVMSIPQAAKLCVESLDFAQNGDVVILKMPKVRIPDLITAECGEHYPTNVIGIRDGERLSEQLMTPEEAMHVKEIGGYYIINGKTRGKCFPSEYDSACPPYLSIPQIKELLK